MSVEPSESSLELGREPRSVAPVRACPVCAQALGSPRPGVGDQHCAMCGTIFLDGDAFATLAERSRVSPSTQQAIFLNGAVTSHGCASCGSKLSAVVFMGQTIEGCAACGAIAASPQAFTALTGIHASAPEPLPPSIREQVLRVLRPAAAVLIGVIVPGAIAHAVAATGVGAALLPAAPATGLGVGLLVVFAALLPAVLETVRLLDARPRLFVAVALLATVGPLHALLVAPLPVGPLLAMAVAYLVVARLLAFVLRAPKHTQARLKWMAPMGVIASSLAIVVPLVALPAARAQRNAGCTDGATATTRGGAHCERNDKRHGPGEERDPHGNLIARGTWKDGARDGSFVLFHPNGQRAAEGAFANNKRTGPWIEYSESGDTVAFGTYELDQRTGIWWHNDDGKFVPKDVTSKDLAPAVH